MKRIIVFDAYGTLFDVNAAARTYAKMTDDDDFLSTWEKLSSLWREKQISYTWYYTSMGYKTKTIYNIILKSFGTPSIQVFLEEASDELEEIVLVQSPFKTSRETPLSNQTFSAVEIETYPGGNNDITRVIQSLPGISPSVGGFRNDIIIRGGGPNETVYYLDGIEIPNINHFSTQGSSGGPVGLVNISFIKDVTLSTSSFGAEYDNALSGVLSFTQKNPNT